MVLTDWPPLTSPTLTVTPCLRSVSLCMATILCAISPMALMPFSKLPPEWAALPAISKARNTPPLRPVTMLPLGRPGSELKTQRAARPTRSITGRDEGEAISSSLVMRPASGAGAPPKRLKAASTKALRTSPDFMSTTPGP